MTIPDDVIKSLDVLEQAVGELRYLRAVVESMKTEDHAFVERHALKIARQNRLTKVAPEHSLD